MTNIAHAQRRAPKSAPYASVGQTGTVVVDGKRYTVALAVAKAFEQLQRDHDLCRRAADRLAAERDRAGLAKVSA